MWSALRQVVRAQREAPPLERVDRAGPLPLSFAQQRIWFFEQLETADPSYNLTLTFRMRGSLDSDALAGALEAIVRRHEALRSGFVTARGRPLQILADSVDGSLERRDLRVVPEKDREQEAIALATRFAQRPFLLSEPPLFRASLLQLRDRDHLLILSVHHIVSDGWSLGILVRELEALYTSLSTGTPQDLPQLPFQYVDFAAWQRRWLQTSAARHQADYWKEQLRPPVPTLDLPTDRARSRVQTFNGARRSRLLSDRLTRALKELCQEQGSTLFMTSLAAFAALLHRYTGEEDIALGSPVANRNRAEIKNVMGPFVNTLVLRVHCAEDPSFVQLVEHVKAVAAAAHVHQDLPFDWLVEELRPRRDLSRTPLFQVMFAFQNAMRWDLRLPRVAVESLWLDRGTAMFDLTAFLRERPGGLLLTLEYNTDLFDEGTIDGMLRHFETLLQGVVADPGRRVSRYPLLTRGERRRELLSRMDGSADRGQDCGVHELFEARAARSPEAAAVSFAGRELTYRELDERANRLAHDLRELGVGPGSLVGIALETSVEAAVAVLGVLKSGAAYVPLDPRAPRRRRTLILGECRAEALIIQGGRCEGALEGEIETIALDPVDERLRRAAPPSLGRRVIAEDLAYVVYTSGSTGRPKGVAVPHGCLVNHGRAIAAEFGLSPGDRVLLLAPLAFDVAAEELFPTWLSGAAVVVPTADRASLADGLSKILDEERVTVLNMSTGLWRQWTADLERSGSQVPRSVRMLVVGSQRVPLPDLARWQKLGPGIDWCNAYGTTEATITATVWRMPRSFDVAGTATVPIGRAITNVQLYVLDRNLEPVPAGAVGELYIGGRGIARGYVEQPGRTAEVFVPNPFQALEGLSGPPGARLFKTGDQTRWRADGQLEFLGRLDRQVKVRGMRVEPAEVEAELIRHPLVREAAVIADERTSAELRLVAYFVPEEGGSVAAGELQAFLEERLPAYMVPSAIVQLEELPLSPGGKVDRSRLPTAETTTGGDRDPAVAPSPLQELVGDVWCDVLGVERAQAHEDFFALGGHSLMAAELVSRLREALQEDLPVRLVFENPKLRALTESIAEARHAGGEPSPHPISPRSREGPQPLSIAQEQLWTLSCHLPMSPLFNIPYTVRVSGPLDPELLERSLDETLRRHDVLRVRFEARDGRPIQIPAPSCSVPLDSFDLRDLPEAERQAVVRQVCAEYARHPFDLGQGSLLRWALLQLAAQEHLLLIVTHHIVSDGWSLSLLVKELASSYEELADGRKPSLPELPIQYADFARWQREFQQSDAARDLLAYWEKTLAGSPPELGLPVDRPEAPELSFQTARQSISIPNDVVEALRDLFRGEGVTLFMKLLAVLMVLLHGFAGAGEVRVGTLSATRDRREIEGLIGLFLNTLILRTDLTGDPSFVELTRRVRAVTLAAFEHQSLPFEQLVQRLETKQGFTRTSLFRVMFILQNAGLSEVELPGLGVTFEEAWESLPEPELTATTFDWIVVAREHADGLGVDLIYKPALFDAATVQAVLLRFRRLAEHLAHHPQTRLSELRGAGPGSGSQATTGV